MQPSLDGTLTGAQLRAARGLLNLSIAELADTSGLAVNTIRRAEGANGPVQITAANAKLLKELLERQGVIFIEAGEIGPGVRLASPIAGPVRSRRRG